MCAAAIVRPIGRCVQERLTGALAARAQRDDQVLEPAAWSVANREDVGVDRGEADDTYAIHGQKDIDGRIEDGVMEAGAPAFDGIFGRPRTRKLEQFFDESKDCLLVGEGSGTNRDRQSYFFVARQRWCVGDISPRYL